MSCEHELGDSLLRLRSRAYVIYAVEPGNLSRFQIFHAAANQDISTCMLACDVSADYTPQAKGFEVKGVWAIYIVCSKLRVWGGRLNLDFKLTFNS